MKTTARTILLHVPALAVVAVLAAVVVPFVCVLSYLANDGPGNQN